MSKYVCIKGFKKNNGNYRSLEESRFPQTMEDIIINNIYDINLVLFKNPIVTQDGFLDHLDIYLYQIRDEKGEVVCTSSSDNGFIEEYFTPLSIYRNDIINEILK